MGTITIFIGLLLVTTVAVYLIIRYKKRLQFKEEIKWEESARVSISSPGPNREPATLPGAQAAILDNPLWQEIGKLKQLKLLVSLATTALPAWTSFAHLSVIHYPNAAFTSQQVIDSQLLAITIDELIMASENEFPSRSDATILKHYQGFIGPVIAMRDSDWSPPYPVKKLFLSIYFMLKSIVEQNDLTDVSFYLDWAMTEIIDCMELGKLYSQQEITAMVAKGLQQFASG